MKDTIAFSREIRKTALEMVYKARASHIGGALSMADLLAVLYGEFLRIDPGNPGDPGRDRFLLSKGHACTGLYATLALKGFFPVEELKTYAEDGSRLLSHTSHKVPGIELSTGSLGHALPVACGLALASRRRQTDFHTWCMLSDGELNEGSNWEAILFAAHHRLTNLTLLIDYNKIQSFGTVEEVLGLEPLKEKFEAFGWETTEIDGHNHEAIRQAFARAGQPGNRPLCIVAHTVKGKGVSYMENKLLWHYRSPSEAEFQTALNELSA